MPFRIDCHACSLAEIQFRRQLKEIGLSVEFDLRRRLLGNHLDGQAKDRR